MIAQPWHDGLLGALAGLGVGLVVLLPVYALRVMGAGDVKLMAMVGAIVGLPDILQAVLYSLIVGGVAAVAFARLPQGLAPHDDQRHGHRAVHGIRRRRRRTPTPARAGRASVGKLPYGVSIAGGTIAWLAARLLGLA